MNEYLASLVDELYNLGLDAVVYSAGSRSTALAMLFEAHQGFQSYMDVDERSAAFFALGLAKTARKPVALVCMHFWIGYGPLPASPYGGPICRYPLDSFDSRPAT